MPASSFSLSTDTFSVERIHLLESGTLEAVSIIAQDLGIGQAEAYAQIFLTEAEAPNPVPGLLLCAGYIGAFAAISWTGNILLEPSYALHVRLLCHATHGFRINYMLREAF